MTLDPPRIPRALPALLLTAAVAAGLLASAETRPAEAAFPGANGKIVFSSDLTAGSGVANPTGDSELFAMNPDGTGLEQLTANTAHDFGPAWSADGAWIAYTSVQVGDIEISMRNYDDGDDVVFIETRRLTTNTVGDQSPAFSPDGAKIAFISARDGFEEIYVMDTTDANGDGNGDNQIRLTNNAVYDLEPNWSPDGAKIAFSSQRDGNFDVYVMDADGTHPVNLTNNAASDLQPDWSPDGSKIAFTRFLGDNNFDVYVMNADGSEPKRLTKKAADDELPAWSPDGKKIAFMTNRGGSDFEVAGMKAKAEGKRNRPKNLTRNDALDYGPNWRPVQ